MNSTPAEFRRALMQVFGNAVSEDGNGLLLTTEAAVLHFAMTAEKPYRLGALRVCLLRIDISVRAGDENAVKRLQEQVDRATQRGGG
jgi:hypothetical protein